MQSTATIVEPTGVPASIEIRIPARAQIIDDTAEKIVTLLKLFKMLIADNAGNITKADISNEPTKFIARTIITAITVAISRL